MNLLAKQEEIHRLRKQTHGCWGDRVVGDSGKVMYTELYLEWITNGNLLYSTWNAAQCYVPDWMGVGFRGEWVKLFSQVRLWNPMDCSSQVPPFMGFSRQEYWSGLPFPSPGDLPDLRIEPWSPALQADSSLSEAPCKPPWGSSYLLYYFCDCSAGSIHTKGNKLSIQWNTGVMSFWRALTADTGHDLGYGYLYASTSQSISHGFLPLCVLHFKGKVLISARCFPHCQKGWNWFYHFMPAMGG